MEKFDKIRLWEVSFRQIRASEAFSRPNELVLEKQTSPLYCVNEARRAGNGMTQIVLTLSGRGIFQYDGKVEHLTPGRGFICPHGDPRALYRYPEDASEPWIFIWMDFCGHAVVEMLDDLIARYGHIFEMPVDSAMVRYFESFKEQKRSFRFITPAEGMQIIGNVMVLLCEYVEKKDVQSPGSHLVQRAQTIIAENLDRALNLQEIANRLGISREHLTKVFHERTGKTPQQYALEERMHLANRLLQDETLRIKEIAQRTGYSSAISFGRAFRQRFGCSPKAYRAKAKT